MHTHIPLVIVVVRVAAVVVMVFTAAALWNFMRWLPWQLDCASAAVASLGFAYKFDRGNQP